MYISTLTLTIIALDRYVIIIHPFRARMQVKTCLVTILLIDLISMAFTAPYAFHVGLVDLDGPEANGTDMLCSETWGGARRTVYGVFTNLSQFALPFATIIACYSAIIRRLRLRAAAGSRPGAPARSDASRRREEQERARAVRTNRMLISMVAVFGACWLPLNTINFVADLDVWPVYCWPYYHLVFFLCHVMAMSSTCYNPFLYGWHNESFRQEFVKMLPALKTICGSRMPANAGGNITHAGGAGETVGMGDILTKNGTAGLGPTSILHPNKQGDNNISVLVVNSDGPASRQPSVKEACTARFNGLSVKFDFGGAGDAEEPPSSTQSMYASPTKQEAKKRCSNNNSHTASDRQSL